jgi:hypothetical protein
LHVGRLLPCRRSRHGIHSSAERLILSRKQRGEDIFLFLTIPDLRKVASPRPREFVLLWFKHLSGNQNRLILVGLCPLHLPAVAFSLVPNMSLHLRAHANSSLSLALSLSLARSFAGSRALCRLCCCCTHTRHLPIQVFPSARMPFWSRWGGGSLDPGSSEASDENNDATAKPHAAGVFDK